MSTTSSIAKPEFENGDQVAGFEVIKKLGSGGFGAVYQVRKDGVDAAMKTEFITEENNQTLKNEVHMLRLMQWSKSFCTLYYAKRVTIEGRSMNIMVMSLCGRPLSRLRRMMPDRHFSRSTAARLSQQILQAIFDLHQTGILHRDVKASNCGWYESTRTVFLYDLGFCRAFLEKNPETGKLVHRKARKSAGFLGTSKYCSVYAHDELDQGRRDDLWSWLYTSAEFFLGSLPWSNEEKSHLMCTRKLAIGPKLFMKCPREMLTIHSHISQLKFDSCPDYAMMFKEIENMCIRLEVDASDPMDFEPGSDYYQKYFLDKETDSEKETSGESLTDGEVTKATRVNDVDVAPELTDAEDVITLNSTKSDHSKEGNKIGTRLAAGIGRAFNKMIGFRQKKSSIV